MKPRIELGLGLIGIGKPWGFANPEVGHLEGNWRAFAEALGQTRLR